MRTSILIAGAVLAGCAHVAADRSSGETESPYLLVFAGDRDEADDDFLAVVDLRPDSATLGKVIATTPIGSKASMPHHMEYVLPPAGEHLFLNAHRHELSLLIDISEPRAPRIAKSFRPPAPLRYPHDYYRTPTGSRLVGFLRSEGSSPDSEEKAQPGNHGGIAEYSPDGVLMRQVSAAVPGVEKAIRPYAFAYIPDADRFVVTSAPMMESTWADVVQIYRYSTFELLHTLELPPAPTPSGEALEGSQKAGFGPRVLADGSVFLNSYGCGFYRLTEIASDHPRLEALLALETPPPSRPGRMRGACGIPVVIGRYWLMPSSHLHAVVVLDLSNPSAPREVFRLRTPETSTHTGWRATHSPIDSCWEPNSAARRVFIFCASTPIRARSRSIHDCMAAMGSPAISAWRINNGLTAIQARRGVTRRCFCRNDSMNLCR